MSKKLIFLGRAENFLRYTDIAKLQGYETLGIIDSDYYNNTKDFHGFPYIGSEDHLDEVYQNFGTEQISFFIGATSVVGSNESQLRTKQKRQKMIEIAEKNKLDIINLIHPTVIIPETCKIGKGVFISAYSVLQNFVEIKDFALLREFVLVADGSVIGKNAVLCQYAYVGAHVDIGDDCYIGVQSSIIRNDSEKIHTRVQIGKNCVTHPGTIVMRSLPENSVVTIGKGRIRGTFEKTIVD